MAARLHRFGRAAAIRDVLVQFPNGATTAQIRTAGGMEVTAAVIGRSLQNMHAKDQVTMKMADNAILWNLNPRLRQAMAIAANRPSAANANAPLPTTSSARGRAGDSTTTVRHREQERLTLAAQVAAFQQAGGKIEVLGNTPLRGNKTRREIIEGSGPSPRRASTGQMGDA
mgnify:CR=1 FL=1